MSSSSAASHPPQESSASEEEKTICFCHCVSEKRIREAIRQGHDTIEKIQAELLASTGCGGCEIDVRALLAEEQTARKK